MASRPISKYDPLMLARVLHGLEAAPTGVRAAMGRTSLDRREAFDRADRADHRA